MIDVEKALPLLGVEPVRVTDTEIVALCPMHEERTGRPDHHPAWQINVETGKHHCFSCGYRGNLQTLVSDLEQVPRPDARRWLQHNGLVSLEVGTYEEAQVRKRRIKAPVDTRVITEAHLRMHQDPPPPEQLERRRITVEGCEHFGVRWDQANRAWVLPVRSDAGLLGYQRKPLQGHPVNVPTGLTKSGTLFGACEFSGDTAVLLESPLDVVRLWCAGVPGGVAAFGASVSDAQAELLVELADTVVLALDLDPAGRASQDQLFERLHGRTEVRSFNYRPALEAFGSGVYDKRPKDIGDLRDEDIHAGLEARRGALKPPRSRAYAPPTSLRSI